MTGPEGTFVHVLRMSPTLQKIRRRLYVRADSEPDPPEDVAGTCPGVGYTLSEWGGVGRGTHRIEMIIRAFAHFTMGDERRFLATVDHPLDVTVTPPPPSLGRGDS